MIPDVDRGPGAPLGRDRAGPRAEGRRTDRNRGRPAPARQAAAAFSLTWPFIRAMIADMPRRRIGLTTSARPISV